MGERSPAERISLGKQNHLTTKIQGVGTLVQFFFNTPTRESDGDGYSKCTWQMMQASVLSKAMQTQDARRRADVPPWPFYKLYTCTDATAKRNVDALRRTDVQPWSSTKCAHALTQQRGEQRMHFGEPTCYPAAVQGNKCFTTC